MADKLDGNVKGLRIGVAEEYFDGISSETLSAVRKAIDFYAEAGAEIVKVSLPMLKDALPVYYIIACAEASSNLGRYDGIRYGYRAAHYDDVNDMIMRTRSEGFGREVKRRIMLGTYVLSSGYFDAYYKKARFPAELHRRQHDRNVYVGYMHRPRQHRGTARRFSPLRQRRQRSSRRNADNR